MKEPIKIYKPPKNSRPAAVCSALLLAAGVVCALSAAFSGPLDMSGPVMYSYIVLAAALLLIAAELTFRFIVCGYVYVLDEDYITISRVAFKNVKCMCELEFKQIRELRAGGASDPPGLPDTSGAALAGTAGREPRIKKRELQLAHGKLIRYMNYCQSLFPARTAAVVFTYDGAAAAFSFEPDDGFVETMRNLMRPGG